MKHLTFSENLEPRRLLSIDFDASSGTLRFEGAGAADHARLSTSGNRIVAFMAGTTRSFQRTSVLRIEFRGRGGNDSLIASSSINVRILADGGAGNDSLSAGSGNDTLIGGSGNDSLKGQNGNDSLDGQAGADFMSGGRHTDTVDYSSRTTPVKVTLENVANDGAAGERDDVRYDIEIVRGGNGNDDLKGNGFANTLLGNGGNDLLRGGQATDLLDGGGGNDSMNGGGGDDLLRGGEGNDLFIGENGTDTADYSDHDGQVPAGAVLRISNDGQPFDGIVVGGINIEFDNVSVGVENIIGSDGADRIELASQPGKIDGRGGDDEIAGTNSSDTLLGGDGNDTIFGGGGDDQIIAGSEESPTTDDDLVQADDGNDSIAGGAGDDTIAGGAGSDTASGGAGNDNIIGEIGADALIGDAGDDSIAGGLDDDSLDGGTGLDQLNGGDGSDTLSDPGSLIVPEELADADEEVVVDVLNGADEEVVNVLDGGPGDDLLSSAGGSVYLRGGAGEGSDTLLGGEGDQVLNGGDGNDLIRGGAGNDFIVGEFGQDSLFGDDGNDTFINADGNLDLIEGGEDLDQMQYEPGVLGETPSDVEIIFDLDEDTDFPDPDADDGDTVNLANNPPHLTSTGTLTITGTTNSDGSAVDDEVSVSKISSSTYHVDWNGQLFSFAATGSNSVKRIRIDLGAGDDSAKLQNSSGASSVTVPATLIGSRGDDLLWGGARADQIIGGLGNDSLRGGAGNDVLLPGLDKTKNTSDGTDILDGGPGISDTADYSARDDGLRLTLDDIANDGEAGEGDQIINIENIFGGRRADFIKGNSRANVLSGGRGEDTIKGGAGIDQLNAALAGDVGDWVYGQRDFDVLFLAGDLAPDRYNVGEPRVAPYELPEVDPDNGQPLDVQTSDSPD